LRLALQLFGNGIQNHGYAPLHRELNFHRCGQQLVNQKNLRHAPIFTNRGQILTTLRSSSTS
ncbi:MAG: hypothetical protein WA956_16245, partial [Stenotrophomonas sp.]